MIQIWRIYNKVSDPVKYKKSSNSTSTLLHEQWRTVVPLSHYSPISKTFKYWTKNPARCRCRASVQLSQTSKSSIRDRFTGWLQPHIFGSQWRSLDVYLPNAPSVAVPPHQQQLVVSLLNHTSKNSTHEPCCLCIMATIWGKLNILSHQLQRSREKLL